MLVKKRKKNIKKSEKRKNRPWLALLKLLRSRKRKRNIAIVMLVKSYTITIIKKATMQILVLSHKTSVGLGNFYAND